MNEDKPEVKDETYDPRAEYDWVPAFLAVSITFAAILALFAPTLIYLLADDVKNPAVVKAAESLGDDNFNMVWIMVVSFWIGRQSVKSLTARNK